MDGLERMTRRAGAVIDHRTGVAAHYGSAAGELAVCVRGVGLADRSHLAKLEVTGPGAEIDRWVGSFAGAVPEVGECRIGAAGRLVARTEDRCLVLTEDASSLPAAPDTLSVSDRSSDWVAIGLAGPAAGGVLSRLGRVAEFAVPGATTAVSIAGVKAEVAYATDRLVLLVALKESAEELWRALDTAGRPIGLSYVGGDAFRRYALWERTAEGAVARAS